MARRQIVAATDLAIAKGSSRHREFAAALLGLEDHPCRKLLDAAPLAGITHERWKAAQGLMDGLWLRFEDHRDILDRLREIRSRRWRPAEGDVEELTDLLATGATASPPLSLDALAAEVSARYVEVMEILSAVERVWGEVLPVIVESRKRLGAAHSRVADVLRGPLAYGGADAVPASAAAAERGLAALARLAEADPLSLWCDSTVDSSQIEALNALTDSACADLVSLTELIQSAERRIDAASRRMSAIREIQYQAAVERRSVLRQFTACNVAAETEGDDLLDALLAAALELQMRKSWLRLGPALGDLERQIEFAASRAQAILADVRLPVQERAELWGRLSAYRAKAHRVGRGADRPLEELHARARELLTASPCPLAAAASAVAAYQREVNDRAITSSRAGDAA